MKILFLSPTGQAGGAEVALVELLAGLRAAQPGWSLSLVAASDGPLVARAHRLGVAVTVLPFPFEVARLGDWGLDGRGARLAFIPRALAAVGPLVRYVWQLARITRAQTPDVLYTNGLKMHLLGACVRPWRAKLVWHVHDYVSRRPLGAFALQWLVRRCAAVVANSASVAADVRAVCGRTLPIHPIWNAVDLARYAPDGPVADLDAQAGVRPPRQDVVRVGLVATFARWKGHRVFLDALARVPETVPVRGYVVGGPVYVTDNSQTSVEELRAEADRLGLGARVAFTGFVPDSAPVMRALDVVVHASTEPEPFGLVIAEAMACGRPVIVAQAGGAAEIVSPGLDALAYPPGDPVALAARITTLAADAAARRQVGEAARRTAERAFDRARLAAEIVGVFDGLSSGPRSATTDAGGSGRLSSDGRLAL